MKFRALAFVAFASVLSPFALAATTPPTSGLLITRINSEQWQVRMISPGSNSERFSGTFESNMPFSQVAPVGQKGTASAQLMSSTMLGTTLSASDGVDFTVSGDAALCLRDTGSSGVNIYLGETLDDAIAVTAPVALTSADACGAVAATMSATTDAAPLYGRKFHPGHYIALMRNAGSQQVMSQSMKPGVVGFVKRYTWRELEPSQGKYNFAGVKSDLAWAQAHGMRLIFVIEDRNFTNEKAGPQYLDK